MIHSINCKYFKLQSQVAAGSDLDAFAIGGDAAKPAPAEEESKKVNTNQVKMN